jgi:hypothetical protein
MDVITNLVTLLLSHWSSIIPTKQNDLHGSVCHLKRHESHFYLRQVTFKRKTELAVTSQNRVRSRQFQLSHALDVHLIRYVRNETKMKRQRKKQGIKAKQTKKKLHGLSPRANYTDRATAACRRSDCKLLRIEGPTWSA